MTITNKPKGRNPYAISHYFSYGAAPGWGPRPEYAKQRCLPYGSRNRMHGYRPWRFARSFYPLRERLIGNRFMRGDCYNAFRMKQNQGHSR